MKRWISGCECFSSQKKDPPFSSDLVDETWTWGTESSCVKAKTESAKKSRVGYVNDLALKNLNLKKEGMVFDLRL